MDTSIIVAVGCLVVLMVIVVGCIVWAHRQMNPSAKDFARRSDQRYDLSDEVWKMLEEKDKQD